MQFYDTPLNLPNHFQLSSQYSMVEHTMKVNKGTDSASVVVCVDVQVFVFSLLNLKCTKRETTHDFSVLKTCAFCGYRKTICRFTFQVSQVFLQYLDFMSTTSVNL